ncbi:Glycosyl transferase family 2 [Virgibacillus subterraneus]|uniref:Glycosyl transferase family 2 n=1 Tax=Virgibacillus subterraneus TaxID=621109 RepID=A0A1H9AIZ5_9BACI|nr:glycosyltransferase [Virgibacillus subterraneus]SEP76565.1 Glycosyl transferase family 2 [Virgibacillus subterraneus]
MKQPLVTVFIPLYNCEEYISEALESVINQSYSNIEIVIIDDGSTDNSVNIVNSYTDPRIRLIKNEINRGIPYTRNLGLQESQGKYMAIIDSDDIAYLTRIEKQVNYMENNPNIDGIGTYYEIFGGRFKKVMKPKNITSEEIKAGLLFLNRIANPTSFLRLETINKYELRYNPEYFVAQDYDMWIQLSKVGELSILPEVLLKYRTGHTNVTKKSKSSKIIQRKKINDSIHRDILDFYNFDLTEVELRVFNEFFNDNYQSEISDSTLDHLPRLLTKMVEHNRRNKPFKEELFSEIIRDTVLVVLNRRKIILRRKLRIYDEVCKAKSVRSITRDLSYMVPKHIYNFLLL